MYRLISNNRDCLCFLFAQRISEYELWYWIKVLLSMYAFWEITRRPRLVNYIFYPHQALLKMSLANVLLIQKHIDSIQVWSLQNVKLNYWQILTVLKRKPSYAVHYLQNLYLEFMCSTDRIRISCKASLEYVLTAMALVNPTTPYFVAVYTGWCGECKNAKMKEKEHRLPRHWV